jgi:hypothetical protein
MRTPRFIGAVAAAAAVAAPAMAASPSCPSNSTASGTVTGTVYSGTSDWWSNTGVGPRTFTLTPQNADADLFVYDVTCGTLLCSSRVGGTGTDTCSTTTAGTVQIEVQYYSSPDGYVNYTLTAPPSLDALGGATGYPSDDCAVGTTVAEGFAGGNYVRLRTTRPDATTTWLCVRAEGPSLTYGGKFVVRAPGATLPALPFTDADVTGCATPGNSVPGPHPLLAGAIGDAGDPTTYLPFLLDSFASTGSAQVCVRAGTFAVRAVVSTGVSVTTPSVSFQPDLTGSHTAQPPLTGTPSGTCQAGPSGVTRYTDVTAAGLRTFLYTWQPSSTVLKLCVRSAGLANAGGVLTVDTTALNGALPSVSTGSDITGCTLSVVRLDQPSVVEVRRSGTSGPAAACVTVGSTTVRVTAATGSGQPPATVTWTPDPGTP